MRTVVGLVVVVILMVVRFSYADDISDNISVRNANARKACKVRVIADALKGSDFEKCSMKLLPYLAIDSLDRFLVFCQGKENKFFGEVNIDLSVVGGHRTLLDRVQDGEVPEDYKCTLFKKDGHPPLTLFEINKEAAFAFK